MTLLIAVATKNYCLLSADRRLSQSGTIVTDSATKATFLSCRNARFAIGYTGLARSPLGGRNHSTEEWLLDTLRAPRHNVWLNDILQALKFGIDETFTPGHLGPEHRISLVLCGYQHDSGDATPYIYRLSNFQGNGVVGSSTIEVIPSNDDGDTLLLAGTTTDTQSRDLSNIISLVNAGRLTAAAHLAYRMTLRASKSSVANNAIGERINCAFLSRYVDTPQISISAGSGIEYEMFEPNNIVIGKSGSLFHGRYCRVEYPTPAIFPPTRSRNLCPCRSGRRYRACHGRQYFPHMQPISEITLSDTVWPSGKRFRTVGFGYHGKTLSLDRHTGQLLPHRNKLKKEHAMPSESGGFLELRVWGDLPFSLPSLEVIADIQSELGARAMHPRMIPETQQLMLLPDTMAMALILMEGSASVRWPLGEAGKTNDPSPLLVRAAKILALLLRKRAAFRIGCVVRRDLRTFEGSNAFAVWSRLTNIPAALGTPQECGLQVSNTVERTFLQQIERTLTIVTLTRAKVQERGIFHECVYEEIDISTNPEKNGSFSPSSISIFVTEFLAWHGEISAQLRGDPDHG